MHSLTPKSKKSVLPHQHLLHVFKHTKCGCFPFRFYFNTNKCIYTQGNIQERPELPPPPDDPPAAPVRRGTYCFAYALSLAIALFCILSSLFHDPSLLALSENKKMSNFVFLQREVHYEMLSDRCKSHDFRSLEMCT